MPVAKKPKQSMSGTKSDPSPAEISTNLGENVAAELGDNFLFTTSHFLMHIQSNTRQLRSMALFLHFLRFLRHLIELISLADLIKYFPKIIIEIDRALGSDNASIRLIGTKIVAFITKKLPAEFVLANIPSFVVTLFPIINRSVDPSNGGFAFVPFEALAVDFAEFDALRLDPLEPQYLEVDSEERDEWQRRPSKLFRNYLTVLFHEEMSLLCSEEARKIAIEVVREVVLSNQTSLAFRDAITSVTDFPRIPELMDLIELHTRESEQLSLNQHLQKLCRLVNHESDQVKLAGLQKLAKVTPFCIILILNTIKLL